MKNSYRLIGSMIAIIVFLLSLSGCTQTTSQTEEITFGVAWPFASDTSLLSEGIDMAAGEINENGGIGGQKLTLLKVDDASEAAEGISVAENLSENKLVTAVIGHKNSYISVPASAIYEEAGLVMLSPSSTAPELTQNGSTKIFRVIPNDNDITQKVAEYLADSGLKRIVIYYSDDSYGDGLADAFENQSEQYGIMVVDRFNYYSGIEDLERMQKRWRAFGYDAIFIATASAAGSQFINDAAQAGINILFAGGNALDTSELSSDFVAKQNIIIGSVFDPEASEDARNFVKNFKKLYGHDPDIYAALGYDAVRALATAINNTKDYDRKDIADELRNLGKWTGVCGVHEFSETGDDIGELVVLKQLKDGKFSRLER